MQLLPIFISNNVFLCYSHTPARLSPGRIAASLQLSGVWESFGLNSLKPSLATPYPPTPTATHHCLTGKAVLFLVKPDLQSLGYSLAPSWIWTLSQPCPCRAGTQPACLSTTYSSGVLRRSRKNHKTNPCISLSALMVWAILSMLLVVLM